ncbi:unnamed protein product, partial [Phaeothamnion confervicola]
MPPLRPLVDRLGLSSIAVLKLGRNQLRALPADLGERGVLQSLTVLDVGFNNLHRLPPEICELTSLVELLLPNNLLVELPAEVTRLDRLRTLDVTQNPLKRPPLETAERGLESMRSYFAELGSSGEAPAACSQVKVVFCGHPMAGKSSIIKCLLTRRACALGRESRTLGLKITAWRPELD